MNKEVMFDVVWGIAAGLLLGGCVLMLFAV